MKSLNIIFTLIVASIVFTACDKEKTPVEQVKKDNINKVTEAKNEDHSVELYTANGVLTQGYNTVYLKIKDNKTNTYISSNALSAIEWMPMMDMKTHKHSCPHSSLKIKEGEQNIFEGYIVYQMFTGTAGTWDLTVKYTLNGKQYTAKLDTNILQAKKRVVNTFKDQQGNRYIMALINPTPLEAKIGLNDIKMGLFQMKNMTEFPIVNNYSIEIDPRMPSMGNHSAPGNTNLTQSNENQFYSGKLGLSMTGYWVINLMVKNAEGNVIKGETVPQHPQDINNPEKSSIYFEIEF